MSRFSQSVVVAVALAIVAQPAHAQFGMLKKLKNSVSSPDSATRAKDSLTQIAAGVKPESVKIGKGLLRRGMSAAGEVNDKLEKTTGISAKDAALAATGIGASGLIAKKMGLDPMNLSAQMMNKANAAGQARAIKAQGGLAAGMGSIAGMPDAATMQKMQLQMQQRMALASAARARAGAKSVPVSGAAMGIPGYSEADAQALVAFQQEMMQVAMAASAGDAAAQARLQSWQTLALKHQPEIEKLTLAAQGGDVTAIQKLQVMQFTLMKEWANTGSTKVKVPRAVKP